MEIRAILDEVSKCNVSIVYVMVDKYNYAGDYYGVFGNDLYEAVLSDLLSAAFSVVNKGDVNVFLDRSSFITLNSFRTIANDIAIANGCNLKKCDKVTSHQNRCVQIADYVAGAINRYFEDGYPYYMDIIREKISIARKNSRRF